MEKLDFFAPRISADTKMFWEGCKEHKLEIQRCKKCGKLRWPAAFLCPDCLTDDMYENASLHDESGAWQMIFGVNTVPSHRRQGHAGLLIRQSIEDAKTQHRKGLVLTCKEALIHYYASFGFKNEGISESVHGNVTWYQMRLTL